RKKKITKWQDYEQHGHTDRHARMSYHTSTAGDEVRSRGGPEAVPRRGRLGPARPARGRKAGDPMAPVTLQRFVEKLAKLKQGTDDARLARIIRELREQGLDADRAVATAA